MYYYQRLHPITLGYKYFVIQPFLLLYFVQTAVFRCIIPSPGQAGVRRLAIVRSQLVQNSLGNKISLYALLRLRKLLIETENKPKINLGDFDLFLS